MTTKATTVTAKALALVSSALQDVEKEEIDALWVRPVMVPLDGSALSERAINWGVCLATRRRSPLLLVRVEEPWSVGTGEALMLGALASGEASPDFDVAIAAATDYLAQHAAALRARNPSLWVQTDVRIGPAAAGLLEAESEHHIQLVVMSTHSRSGAERWVRGSVAEKLLRHGAAPILLVRADDQLAALEGDSGRGIRVLVPLDRSTLAVSAVGEALRLVRTFEGSDPCIELFHAIDSRSLPTVGRYHRAEAEARSRVIAERQAHAYLAEVAELLSHHRVRAERTVVFSDDAAQDIVAAATRGQANAIVMCTHGRGAFGRWLVGSVADRVAHAATVPVMLYRPPTLPAAATTTDGDLRVPAASGSVQAPGASDSAA